MLAVCLSRSSNSRHLRPDGPAWEFASLLLGPADLASIPLLAACVPLDCADKVSCELSEARPEVPNLGCTILLSGNTIFGSRFCKKSATTWLGYAITNENESTGILQGRNMTTVYSASISTAICASWHSHAAFCPRVFLGALSTFTSILTMSSWHIEESATEVQSRKFVWWLPMQLTWVSPCSVELLPTAKCCKQARQYLCWVHANHWNKRWSLRVLYSIASQKADIISTGKSDTSSLPCAWIMHMYSVSRDIWQVE